MPLINKAESVTVDDGEVNAVFSLGVKTTWDPPDLSVAKCLSLVRHSLKVCEARVSRLIALEITLEEMQKARKK